MLDIQYIFSVGINLVYLSRDVEFACAKYFPAAVHGFKEKFEKN